ncbi:MAG: nitroreductase family protein [Candidatus Nanoarchaeia archaeon]|nr:nitroreductase family protein [Candidatus Nanoarchaeia archaeon]
MDMLELIKKRRSVRDYLEKNIENDKLFKVLEAGRWSPSSGNVQNWRFVVVNDYKIKSQISEACLGQYWISNAPAIIIVLSDDSKLRMLFGQRGEMNYSIQNCSIAMQNMMLEAESLGLSSSWVGAYDEDKILRIMKVEDLNIVLRGIFAIGYGKNIPSAPVRLDLDKLVYFNTWGNKSL